MNQEAPTQNALIGVEVRPTSLHFVKIKNTGEVISESRVPFAATDAPIAGLCRAIEEFRREFGPLDRLGIAVPGLVAHGSGLVAYSSVIAAFSGVNIAEAVESETGISARVENDANAAAFAEYQVGAGKGSSSMFYVTIGSGVGGSFISDGEIWRGANGFAGEFGYMTINSEGLRLEDVASAQNIVRRTVDRFNRDNTSSLAALPESEIDLAAILRAAEDEDDLAILMLERTGSFIGTALASVINLLNIETVVIGGELTAAGDMVLEHIVERSREFSFGPSFDKTRIVPSSLKNAGAIGAALLAGL